MLDGATPQIERYMDLLSARQKLVASNIANVDTPGYKTKDINFSDEFSSAISTTSPIAHEVDGLKTKNDGNNVSIDRESRLLSEDALRFNMASQILRQEIKSMKSAIEEGKGG